MTQDKTLMVFASIQPGEPVSAETIMKRTGLSRADAGQRLSRLCQKGKLVKLSRGVFAMAGSIPAFEQFAAEIRAAESIKRVNRRKAAQARYAKKLEAARAISFTPKARTLKALAEAPLVPKDVVSFAIANQPALARAWG